MRIKREAPYTIFIILSRKIMDHPHRRVFVNPRHVVRSRSRSRSRSTRPTSLRSTRPTSLRSTSRRPTVHFDEHDERRDASTRRRLEEQKLQQQQERREDNDREYYLDLALRCETAPSSSSSSSSTRSSQSSQPNRRSHADLLNEYNRLKEKRKREKSTIPEERRKKAKLETQNAIFSGQITRNRPTETQPPPPPPPPSSPPSPPSLSSSSPPSSTSKPDVGETEKNEFQKQLLLKILTYSSLKKQEETKEKEKNDHEKHLQHEEHVAYAQKVLEEMVMKNLPISVNAYRNKTPPSSLHKVSSTYKASKVAFTMVQHMEYVNKWLLSVVQNMQKEAIKVSHVTEMEIARQLKCDVNDPRIEPMKNEVRSLANRNLTAPLKVDRCFPAGAKEHPWVEWIDLVSVVKEMNDNIEKISKLSPNMIGATVYEAFDYIDH